MPKKNLADRSIGAKLKKSRLMQNIELDYVYSAIKIRPKIIELIEADKFFELGSSVYVKGLLKSYTKFLGLNSQSMVNLYIRDWEDTDPGKKNKSSYRKPKNKQPKLVVDKRLILLLAAVIFLVFAINVVSNLLTNSFKTPVLNLFFPVSASGGEVITYAITGNTFYIEGESDGESTVTINNVPVVIDPTGKFRSSLLPFSGEDAQFVIKATNSLNSVSQITLNVQKAKDFLPSGKVVEFSIGESAQFLLLKADNVVLFNDLAMPDYNISFEFFSELEIQSAEPSKTTVKIDDKLYPLSLSRQIFRIVNKELLQEN